MMGVSVITCTPVDSYTHLLTHLIERRRGRKLVHGEKTKTYLSINSKDIRKLEPVDLKSPKIMHYSMLQNINELFYNELKVQNIL